MNIVYASDENFVEIMGVSIVSLLENNRNAENLNIHIIEDNISQGSKEKIQSLVKSYNRSTEFHKMPDIEKMYNVKLDVPAWSSNFQWSLSMFSRLFQSSLFPGEIEKTLYIDCDTLILKSIEPLLNENIDDFYAAGVLDTLPGGHKTHIGLEKNDSYFNSGVLLFNLKKMRHDGKEKELVKSIIQNMGLVDFADQDIINMVMGKDMKVLPLVYNSMSSLFSFSSYKALLNYRNVKPFYTGQEYSLAIKDPVIVHFTQEFFIRPWVDDYKYKHPFTNEWHKYKSMSPWRDAPPRKPQKTGSFMRVYRRISKSLPIPVYCFFYQLKHYILFFIKHAKKK